MIRYGASACIDAPATEVWNWLERLEDIQPWSEAVISAECTGKRTRGVGAERTCRLAGGLTRGTLGRLLAPLVLRQIRRVAPRTVAAFKYLVEHGEAPPGKHSRLPVPAAVC